MDKRDAVRLSIAGGIVLILLIVAKHRPSEEPATGDAQTAVSDQATAPSVVYVPVPVQQTSSAAQQLLFDSSPATITQPYTAPPAQPVYQPPPIDALPDQSTQAVEVPQVTLTTVDVQPNTPPPSATFNAQTGEIYPGVPGGSVNLQTGAFYPSVPGGGTVDPQTGAYNPRTGE